MAFLIPATLPTELPKIATAMVFLIFVTLLAALPKIATAVAFLIPARSSLAQ